MSNQSKTTYKKKKLVNFDLSSGEQTIIPDKGGSFAKITINRPDNLIPENIRNNVNIAGVVGTMRPSYALQKGDTIDTLYINTTEDTHELNEWLDSFSEKLETNDGGYVYISLLLKTTSEEYCGLAVESIDGTELGVDGTVSVIIDMASEGELNILYSTHTIDLGDFSVTAGWQDPMFQLTVGGTIIAAPDDLSEDSDLSDIDINLFPDSILDKYFSKKAYSFGGAGSSMPKPRLTLDLGQEDSFGWYPDTGVIATNLLDGMNGALKDATDGSKETIQGMGSGYIPADISISDIKKDDAYVPHAQIIVSISDETYLDMCQTFYSLKYTNPATREWFRTALSQIQNLDFLQIMKGIDDQRIDITILMKYGMQYINPLLGALVCTAYNSINYLNLGLQIVQPMLYNLGACLDIRVHKTGYGQASEASDPIKWYFNTLIVKTSSGTQTYYTQNLNFKDEGLCLLNDSQKQDDATSIPSHFASTTNTLFTTVPGREAEVSNSVFSKLYCYKLGLIYLANSTQSEPCYWVESVCPISKYTTTNAGGIEIEGHGALYLVQSDESNSPVSLEKYSSIILDAEQGSIAFGESKNTEESRYLRIKLNGIVVYYKGFTSGETVQVDYASFNQAIKMFPNQEQYEFELCEVGMTNMPSDPLMIKTNSDGEIIL